MARTGRFGRLPTSAPDLSSQIVSLMEQWQNANDRNILDAWQNRGRLNGKKVTDQDMIRYYKKRRDMYDKSDPEYAQWDNDLWQLRFQISNETVMMNYRMGRIGPRAVAAHYRQWANSMPRNSSFYRNMMQSYGDFMKAARATHAKAKKAFDYNGMLARIDRNNRDTEDAQTMTDAITEYARSHGYLDTGQNITDLMNRWSAGDISNMLIGLTGVIGTPASDRGLTPLGDNAYAGLAPGGAGGEGERWDQFKAAYKRQHPDWDGTMSWDVLIAADNKAIRAHQRNIEILKAAPFDTRSLQAGERNQIRELRQRNKIPKVFSAFDRVNDALNDWNEQRDGAQDGKEFIAHDAQTIKDLQKAKQQFMDAGRYDLAGGVDMYIRAINGSDEDVKALQGLDDSKIAYQMGLNPGDLENIARAQNTIHQGIKLVDSGDAVWYKGDPNAPVVPDEVTRALTGQATPPEWGYIGLVVDPKTGLKQMPDDTKIIGPSLDSEDHLGPRAYDSLPIYMGTEQIGVRVDVDGQPYDGFYDDNGILHWPPYDVYDGTDGISLRPVNSGNDRHFEVVASEQAVGQQWWEGIQTKMDAQSFGAIVDESLGVEPDQPVAGQPTGQPTGGQPQPTGQPTGREAGAYRTLQELLGGGNVPPKGSLPTLDAQITVRDENDLDSVAQARIDTLKGMFPIWQPGGMNVGGEDIDSEAAQTARIRAYLRNTDMPTLPYTPEDAKYYNQSGDPTLRVTEADKYADQLDPTISHRVADKQAQIANAPQGPPPPVGTTPPTPGQSPAPQTPEGGQPSGQPPQQVEFPQGWGTSWWGHPVNPQGQQRPTGETSIVQARHDFWDNASFTLDQQTEKNNSFATDPKFNGHIFTTSFGLMLMNASPDKAKFSSQYTTSDLITIDAMNHSQTPEAMVQSAKDWADYGVLTDVIGPLRKLIANGANPDRLQIAAAFGNLATRDERRQQMTDIAEQIGYDTPEAPIDQAAARWQAGQTVDIEGHQTPVEDLRVQFPGDVPAATRPQPELKIANNLADLIQLRQQNQRVGVKVPVIGNVDITQFVPQRMPDFANVGISAAASYTPPALSMPRLQSFGGTVRPLPNATPQAQQEYLSSGAGRGGLRGFGRY